MSTHIYETMHTIDDQLLAPIKYSMIWEMKEKIQLMLACDN